MSRHDELDIISGHTLILVHVGLRSKKGCQFAHFHHIQIFISFDHIKAYPHVQYAGIFKNIAFPLHFGLSSTCKHIFLVTEIRTFWKTHFLENWFPVCMYAENSFGDYLSPFLMLSYVCDICKHNQNGASFSLSSRAFILQFDIQK